jgi:hypothetical protein
MRNLGILALSALLAGCSVGADVPLATNAAAGFHRQLDAGKFAESYAAGAPELRGATTQQEWVQLLDAVHRKLGKFQSAAQTGWNDQMNTGGHFIVLTYQAKYERGAASEEFVYKIEGGKALLAGYHVNSNAFLVN